MFNIQALTRQCLDCRIRPNFARLDPPSQDTPEIGIGIQNCREKLEFVGILNGRCWHIVDDEIEERCHIRFQTFRRFRSPAFLRRGKQHRKVELVLAGIKCCKEIESFVVHFVRPCFRLVDLVDQNDRPQAETKRLAHDKLGLRHWALSRVDQYHDAVDHTKDTFDFAAKIGVPRGIDNIYARIAPLYRCALCKDGNATFAFLVIAIHGTLRDTLVIANETTLPQQAVDKRRLPMIDMGDDRDVSYVHLAPSIGCPDNCRASYSGGGWKQAAAVPYRSRIASLKSPRNGSSRYSITERVPVRMLAIICVPGNTS